EGFLVEHAGVDEDDVHREPGCVGHVAEHGTGALHARQDRGARAERGVSPGEDVDRRTSFEATVRVFEIATVETHCHSLNFCAMGIRRPMPKAFSVTMSPGAFWCRLYSLPSTRPMTRATTSAGIPSATMSSRVAPSSTKRSRTRSSRS